jgi:ArsR family transcriptional regulator
MMNDHGTAELQRAFKTLSDPTRVRVLSLLTVEELAVQELMEILQMAQSRVSGHLRILREAGLLADRRQGTYAFYRFMHPASGPWKDCWELLRRSLGQEATCESDLRRLHAVVQQRAVRAHAFFEARAPEWDALRSIFNDDALRARAVTRLVEPGLLAAEVGTGTGVLAVELARQGMQVIAVDHSAAMLEAARAKIAEARIPGIELRKGEASRLPIADGEVDAAFAHMVLRYLPQPAQAIEELARVVRPGGRVVVIDFVRHDFEWMHQELGVQWLGFQRAELDGWFREAGLCDLRFETYSPSTQGRDLPATFILSATRPGEAS